MLITRNINLLTYLAMPSYSFLTHVLYVLLYSHLFTFMIYFVLEPWYYELIWVFKT